MTIWGAFTFTGKDTEAAIKVLKPNPNWLLNYVYTAASVISNVNQSTSSDRIDFEVVVDVSSELAPLRGTLNWRLLGAGDELIACYNIPIQLVL